MHAPDRPLASKKRGSTNCYDVQTHTKEKSTAPFVREIDQKFARQKRFSAEEHALKATAAGPASALTNYCPLA